MRNSIDKRKEEEVGRKGEREIGKEGGRKETEGWSGGAQNGKRQQSF